MRRTFAVLALAGVATLAFADSALAQRRGGGVRVGGVPGGAVYRPGYNPGYYGGYHNNNNNFWPGFATGVATSYFLGGYGGYGGYRGYGYPAYSSGYYYPSYVDS